MYSTIMRGIEIMKCLQALLVLFIMKILSHAKMWRIMILRFLTDNYPVHQTTEVRQALQRTGTLCIYVPPYCP